MKINAILILILLSLTIFIFGCTTKNAEIIPNSETPGANEIQNTAPVYFDPTEIRQAAILGEEYNHSFCELYGGDPAVTTPSGICDRSDELSTPSGGNPPYHFQLESGSGFPPMGTTLRPNGFLEGVPTAAGISKFTVCAVDQAGTQKCAPVSLETKDAKVTVDSITCESIDSMFNGPTYRVTIKGTAKGPKDARLYYDSNINSLTDQVNGFGTMGDPEKLSGCEDWSVAEEYTGSIKPRCVNDKGDDTTTSWTIVSEFAFDKVYGYQEGQSTSFTFKGGAHLEDSTIFNEQTAPALKEAICG